MFPLPVPVVVKRNRPVLLGSPALPSLMPTVTTGRSLLSAIVTVAQLENDGLGRFTGAIVHWCDGDTAGRGAGGNRQDTGQREIIDALMGTPRERIIDGQWCGRASASRHEEGAGLAVGFGRVCIGRDDADRRDVII